MEEKKMATERKELFYTDMSEIFGPKENMSEKTLKDKWRVVAGQAQGKPRVQRPRGPATRQLSPMGWGRGMRCWGAG